MLLKTKLTTKNSVWFLNVLVTYLNLKNVVIFFNIRTKMLISKNPFFISENDSTQLAL